MTNETQSLATHPSPPRAAEIRRLTGGVSGRDVTVIGSAPARKDGYLGHLCRSVREQFQAMTDIGLSGPAAAGPPPGRQSLSGRGGLPALSYLAAGNPEGRRVVFVHGTPGQAKDWTPFLRNVPADQYRLAVDRPGFGQSGPGAPVVALSGQARAIAALLETGPEPAILVGSSYGGPVALRVAADHPGTVAGVLLVGAAADPGRERTHPLQRLAATQAVARLLPRPLAHSNAELLALRGELEALGESIGRIRAPVTILQGLRDTLVPPANVGYLFERLTGAAGRRVMLVEKAGHFLHILMAGLVETALAQALADADRASEALRRHLGSPGFRHAAKA